MSVCILHLEDNDTDSLLINRHLKSKKFECTIIWVANEADFRKALSQGGIDLILSDYRMPKWNGDQALAFVMEKHPDIPFIMVTGELGEERALETVARGATDYVLKGNLARLVPACERALREAAVEKERKAAIEQLKESEQFHRILFDDGPLPKWIIDLGTLKFLDVNRAAERHYGYSREEFLRMKASDVWHEKDAATLVAHLTRLPEDRQRISQVRHRKKDRTVLEVETCWTFVTYKGRSACFSVVTDVTELVALRDRLRRELADMTRLHELSTELLKESTLERSLRRVLEATVELLGADKGHVQVYDPKENALKIVAQVGFDEDYIRAFASMPEGHGVSGDALSRQERVLCEDVFTDARFEHLSSLYSRHGVVAVQSTPLVSTDGKIFGMLSTHFGRPHRPSERELRLLDLYVQQAARLLEVRQFVSP